MHALVTRPRVDDPETAAKVAREERAPSARQQPGLVAAYWIDIDDRNEGMSIRIFESEDAARRAKDDTPAPPSDVVSVETREVGEVIAST